MSYTKTSEITTLTLSERLGCYAQLFKIRLTSFVVISAIFGYFIGAESYNFPVILLLALGGFMVTCASNAFNQVIEKNYDKLMDRTKNRPLPLNKFTVSEAVWTASILSFLGITILWIINPLSGVLGALAIFMYVALYTPLKRISTISVFVGAFPGAIPPMLGWVAATGSFSVEAGILFFIQFVWQFPHFWAIAWKVNSQYTKAGFKMLPYGKKNRTTAFIILMSVITLFATSVLPEYFGFAGRMTTIGLSILSLLMMYPAIKLLQTKDDKFALRVLLMSYLYLIVSLTIILVDRFI
jgi:protoheme IX farnesyltransferase